MMTAAPRHRRTRSSSTARTVWLGCPSAGTWTILSKLSASHSSLSASELKLSFESCSLRIWLGSLDPLMSSPYSLDFARYFFVVNIRASHFMTPRWFGGSNCVVRRRDSGDNHGCRSVARRAVGEGEGG